MFNHELTSVDHMTSVIRQKGECQNGGNKKAKHAKFSEKRTFTPCHLPRIRGVRNVRFSENLACFAFLYLRVKNRAFALLPTKRGVARFGTICAI